MRQFEHYRLDLVIEEAIRDEEKPITRQLDFGREPVRDVLREIGELVRPEGKPKRRFESHETLRAAEAAALRSDSPPTQFDGPLRRASLPR